MNVISIICYKPDGIDTCRGCVMARYSADFEMQVFDDPKEAAWFTARKTHDNRYKEDQHSPDWETVVMINGKVASYNDYCSQDHKLNEPEEGLYSLFKHHFNLAETKLKEEREKALAAEAKRKEVIEAKAVEDAKSKRRQLFEDLKKEFS